jgi:hypothetical protein
MRKLLSFFIALAAIVAVTASSFAQLGGGLMFPGPGTSHSAGVTPLSWIGTDAQAINNGFGTTATFTGRSIGAATASDTVTLFIADDEHRAKTSVTIGGVTATQRANTGDQASWYTATGVSSSTPTVVITAAAGFGEIAIALGWIPGSGHTFGTPGVLAAGFRSDPQQVTATVAANGVGIAGIYSEVTGKLPLSWTGGTRSAASEASDGTGNTITVGAASTTTAGSQTLGASGTSSLTNSAMAMIVVSP